MLSMLWSFINPEAHYPELPSSILALPYLLFLEAPPMGFFAGVYIIANHKRAVVLYCFRHTQRRNLWLPFLLGCYANVSVFSREITEHPTYLSS